MHVYGVGVTGKTGAGVHQLLSKKYNQGRGRREGNSAEKKVVPSTVNAEVQRARLIIESNRVAKPVRPFIKVDTELLDVWGDMSDNVDHVSFVSNNRPTMQYKYPLKDEEIKGLIDAGLYRNPKFEALLNKLMEREQFEVAQDITIQSLNAMVDDDVVPIIMAHDVGLVEQVVSDEDTYTSFGAVIERAVDMALQLEAEGISADSLVGQEEELDEEVFLEIDNALDVEAAVKSTVNTDLDVESDAEVDLTNVIDEINVFGQTDEQQRILQLKDASERGVDWDSFTMVSDQEDEAEAVHVANAIDNAEEIHLTNMESFEIELADEDEDEDELEF